MFFGVPVPQMDGSKFASANCGPAVCSLLVNLTTVDALRIGPQKIRTASGVTYDAYGKPKGIEGGLLAKTVNQLTGYLYPFTYASFADWADVRERLERQSIGIIIDCSKTVNTKYRTGTFRGNHWLTVAGGSIKDGTIKYEDPGTTSVGWQRIPLQLLREASDFGGRHWIIQTPPTEDVAKNATGAVAVRAKADVESKRIGRLAKGDDVHVRKTTKGGPWARADGTKAHGWHQVTFKGQRAFIKGEGLR